MRRYANDNLMLDQRRSVLALNQHEKCLYKKEVDNNIGPHPGSSKQESFTHCCFKVGGTSSSTLAQHWNSIGLGLMPGVWWEVLTIGDCPMFRRFYVQKVLCSENICSKGSMFNRFYIQKVLCSEGPMFRRSYIQKVLCSEGPMFRKYLFKRSYIQKVLCSEGPIFRYIQKVLYSENYLFDVGKNFQFQVNYNAR